MSDSRTWAGSWPRRSAYLVLAVSLAATAVAWWLARATALDEADLRFRAEAERVRLFVSGHLGAYEQVLRGGVSLFHTWPSLGRDAWRSYVEGLEIEKGYPGIQGVGYAVVVPAGGIAEHESRVRAEGFPDYALNPAGDRDGYSAILYLEPFDWRNRRAFGFDMMSEPVRRAAMEQARDTGASATSGKVTLVQETESDVQPGFLMYLPVYRDGRVPETIEARRDALLGWVYAPFRMDDLMRGILRERLSGLRLEVFDGASTAPAALLFDSAVSMSAGDADPASTSMFRHESRLALPGYEWTLRFSTLPAFEAGVDHDRPVIIAGTGVMLSALLFLITWSVASNADRIRRKEEEFRYLFERNPSGMWVHDRESLGFLAVNDAAIAQYGYSGSEFLAMRVTDLYPPEDAPRLLQALRAQREGSDDLGEWRHRLKDGSVIDVVILSNRIDYEGRPSCLVVARDVTARKRSEAALRQSEESARRVIETSIDAFIRIDGESRVLEWNQRAEAIFGWRRDEVLGARLTDLIIPDEDRAAHEAGMRRFAEHGEGPILDRRVELTARCKSGDAIPVELSATATRSGSGYVFNAFVRDLTDQRHAEAQLRQAQKMEAVGRLTGGVAHDFNNLLTVVLGNAEMLADRAADSQSRRLADVVVSAALRGSDLVRQLLAFARRQTLQPTTTDVAKLAEGMEGLLARALGEDIEIRILSAEDAWTAMADQAQLESALLNLAINARDAMPDGGKLTIEVANAQLDADYAARNVEVTPGDYVVVAVTDTGAGMPPDILDRVFEPFFTTKGVGKGSGLGLSMVYGYVKQIGGHTKIYSEVGQGTTVRLYLPRAGDDAVLRRRPAESDSRVHGRNEVILVVEDDELVRGHVEAQLTSIGYRVISAGDGPSALAILGEEPEIDLLFTDVIIPGGMNGRTLADEVLRRRPEIKVLFTSGYTENAIVHQGRLDPGVRILNKPYRRAELARMVRSVLDD